MRVPFKSAELQALKRWTKIVILNLLVFLVLLIAAEVLLRSIWTIRSCAAYDCDLSRIAGLKVRYIDQATDIGLTRFDGLLGYVPREGFSATLNAPGWHNSKVTIRMDGFRSNGSEPPPVPADILAVGDSFTFGDQVADDETWPACLERKLGRGVDNGGVNGYGTAQALRRASLKLAGKNYSTLVLSIVVASDFDRDRLSYRTGFPKPAVIHSNNGLAWSAVPDANAPGTKYNPRPNKSLALAYERSEILAAVFDRLFPENNIAGDRLTLVHPNAADENEIVEWTLRKFSDVNIANKMLLLQYASLDTDAAKLAEKRNFIHTMSDKLSLKVIDTEAVLRNAKETDVWYSYGRHHTPLGNAMICSYLFEHGFQ